MNKQIAIVMVLALLAASVAGAAVFFTAPSDAPARAGPEEGELSTVTHYEQLMAQLEQDGIDTLTDTDGDELPDALENFVYGSDPNDLSTTGNGIPDGWFARYGYDPTMAGVEQLPAAIPPEEEQPEVYEGDWPERYRWSLADAYSYGMPEQWPNETFWDNGIDPRLWQATPGGLPTSWLVRHFPVERDGNEATDENEELEILDPGLPERSLTGDGFTVRDNYEHDTDPNLQDTDGDGLSDADEVNRYDTDPRLFSTSGTGVPDGWLVRYELDALDRMVGVSDPAGKGMNVSAVWKYNLERFDFADALQGEGLAPAEMSHRGDVVPDGWLVEHALDPLEPDIAQDEYQCASDYEHVRNLEAADTPEGKDPIPDLCLTVEDAYLFGRPTSWREQVDGPWPGGLDPAEGDQEEDGLPDAVEVRGWYVERTVDIGPGATGEWIHVTSEPRRADTDGDGLTDYEEYHGRGERDGQVYVFPPSDPSNPDTAFSGMSDAEKVFASFGGQTWDLHEQLDDGTLRPLLDPTRRDTAEDHLADGQAMGVWIEASRNLADRMDYDEVYPGSGYKTYLQWMNELDWLTSDLEWEEAAALMAPDGDIDNDGVPNVADPSASGDGLLNGWQVNPSTLRFSDFPPPTDERPRSPIDPANQDTAGNGLPDAWELRHGRWDTSIQGGQGGWDLNPLKYDSSGDGESDFDGNLNNDVVTWHSYDERGRETANPWGYTNGQEFRANTNPRLLDENNIGVTEGWVAFWGSVYPDWIAGTVEPDAPLGVRPPSQAEIDAIQNQIGSVQNPVGEMVKDDWEYLRFVILPTTEPDSTFLVEENDEEFRDDWPRMINVPGEGETPIAMIDGVFEHTHADDQQYGLNPYLLDTDGDGLPDAWEVYYFDQDVCTEGPDPTRTDARQDPDGDGLTNLQEYEVGTHPCLADTDLDGLDDATELFLPGRWPLLPVDEGVGSGDEDTSGTGLTDQEEVERGLDPRDPDTDRDGLLDHLNRAGPDLAEEDLPFIDWFKQLGIAHRDQACPGKPDDLHPVICFYGEEDAESDPTDPYDIAAGDVPDGWAIYYQVAKGENVQEQYACGMPPWWERELLSVWWWGVRPTDACDLRDRDRDGLDDDNGEDPVPAASQSNRGIPHIEGRLEGYEGVDLQDLMTDPPDDPLELVMAAQGWGECAGNPEPCFSQWAANEDTLEQMRKLVSLELADHDLGGTLGKEQEFTVGGRLVVDCESGVCGVPSRTVVLRLWDTSSGGEPLNYDVHSTDFLQNGVSLGIALTDEDGWFDLDSCLCIEDGAIEVPEGRVALGRSNTSATWDRFADRVEVGSDWELGIHVYASVATFWGDPGRDDETHPQYLEVDDDPVATMARWESLEETLRVTSDTTLTFDNLPEQLAWSDDDREISVTMALNDASGGGVPGQSVQVTVVQDGVTISGSRETGTQGTATVDLPLGDHTGTWQFTASFDGDPAKGLESAASDPETVILQAPLELTAPDVTKTVRINEPSEFTVTARSPQGDPIEGVKVTAILGAASQSANTTTNGVATIKLTPTDMEPGDAAVTFRVDTTPEYISDTTAQSVRLVSGSLLQAHVPDEGRLGTPLMIDGRLSLADGTPLPGETIHARLGETSLGEFTTREDGRFQGAPVVPLEVSIGTHTLHLEYEGTSVIDAASLQKAVAFTMGTRIALEEMHAGRGQDFQLEGRLTSLTGHPLVGEHVNVTLPWNETREILARSSGAFHADIQVPEAHPLGIFQVNASYPGSTNGTFGSVNVSVPLAIGSPSVLETDPPDTLHRGNNTVTARLLDEETGDPIEGATIQATASFSDEAFSGETDENGRVRIELQIGRDVEPGPINFTYRFDGDERYGPAEGGTSGILRVTPRLVLTAPWELGRGTGHDLQATLLDDRGQPLVNRSLGFEALGTTWNVTTDEAGQARTAYDLPLGTPLGEGQVSVSWDGDEAHDAVRQSRTVEVKDGVIVTVEGIPDEVRPGDRIALNLNVEDTAGDPVQTPLVVRIDQVPGSILVETDEEGRGEASFIVPETNLDHLRVSVRFAGTDNLAARTEVFEPSFAAAGTADATEPGSRIWLAATAALTAAGLAGGLALVVVRRKRTNQVGAILEESRRQIEAGNAWTGAVLLAYKQLVDRLKDHDIEQAEEQTPRAFAQSLVDVGFMDPESAAMLVSLFERARYADQGELTQDDAFHAREILAETVQAAERTEAQAQRPDA